MKTLLIILCIFVSAISQTKYVYCGYLLDVKTGDYMENVTVVIKDDRIIDIKDTFLPEVKDIEIIDLKNKFVLPGLMDMHTHLSSEFTKDYYTEKFRLNPEDYAYRSTVFAKRTLLAGFTTVRELGGIISTSLKNAIANGYVEGPRIFSAGKSIATTGGHADLTNSLNRSQQQIPNIHEGVINSVEDARKAVRQRYKDGADCIKITATGGVLSPAKNGQNPQFTHEELKAIIQTANDYGMHVAAHAHGKEGMKRAILAGVKSIEHGTYMDSEIMDLMKENGTYYVPTILAGKFVAEKSKIDGFFPEIVRPKAAKIGPLIQATFSKAQKAGVKIAFGTDSGVSEHGKNAEEFSLMVTAGMSPIKAIQAATLNSADLLNESENLGTIEKGKYADIIAVDLDPLKDITSLMKIVFVMKNGIVYKNK
jgi:imidazolonepropionase-like amidohydrolase